VSRLEVRTILPREWVRWRELRLRALADAPDAFGETLEHARTRDEAGWRDQVSPKVGVGRFVAEHEGALVGMVVLVAGARFGHANVYAMWVAPEARRLGVGTVLLDEILELARVWGALDIELHVSDRAPDARAFYLRYGFVASGEREPLREGAQVGTEVLRLRLPPLVMGVVNVTPDSFSDGGEHFDAGAAIAHGEELLAAGADILDIGGEATNPRATPVTAAEELRRVLPVVNALAPKAAVSIDTTKAEVARICVSAGARIVNDVSGGVFDAAMISTIRELGVRYIAGHLRGRTLAEVFSAEGSVSWQTVAAELVERISALTPSMTWIDPGLGFGKGSDPEGNVALLRHAGDIAMTVGCPIVIGASRKRFVRRVAGLTESSGRDALDAASTLATIAAVRAGAHVVRVHNVALLKAHLTAYNRSRARAD